jgi:hypothetical protein
MIFAFAACLLSPSDDAPSIVRAFTFRSGRNELNRRIVVGRQDGGIYGLGPTGSGRAFDLPGLVNAPVTAIEEGFDGHYVWSVAGSSNIFHFSGGTTAAIETGLTTPVVRIDPWGELVAVQGQGEVRFLNIRDGKRFGPSEIFDRNNETYKDIVTAIAAGPCIFAWRNGRGTVVSVARVGKYLSPKEPDGTLDMSYVRAWRVDARKRSTWLGGLFLPLVPFDDAPGKNRIQIGSRVYEAPVGASSLSNLAVTSEGVVAVTHDMLRAIPFEEKNWELDEPVSLPIPASYPSGVSGAGNLVWYTDGERIFQYSVDSSDLSVFLKRRPGRIRSIAGDETGVWIATDSQVQRLTPADAGSVKSLGYLQMEIRGEGPRFGRDQQSLKRTLESPLPNAVGPAASFNAALKQSKIKFGKEPVPHQTGDLSYGDVVTQGSLKGFFVGNMRVRRWDGAAWTEAPIDVRQPFSYQRFCKIERPVFRPGNSGNWSEGAVPIAPVPIGPNGLRWIPNSTYDRPYRPAHNVMQATIEEWLGTPYRWGGNSRNGIDCSGFVHMVYNRAGVSIPRQSQSIRWFSRGIYPTDQLKWGDVIAIDGHVLMYAGSGRTAESLGGIGVTYSRVSNYRNGTVRRFIQ